MVVDHLKTAVTFEAHNFSEIPGRHLIQGPKHVAAHIHKITIAYKIHYQINAIQHVE